MKKRNPYAFLLKNYRQQKVAPKKGKGSYDRSKVRKPVLPDFHLSA